jgi:hypothetical protein
MPTPIKKSDLVEGKLLDSVIEEFQRAEKANNALNKSMRETAKLAKRKIGGSNQGNTSELNKTKAALAEANQLFNQKVKLESESIKNQALLSKLRQQQLKEQNAINKSTKTINGAYKQQSARLNDLRRQYKDLAVTNKGNTRESKNLLREITKLDAKLKKVDSTVGQNQRSVGNYSKAIGGLRNGLARLGLVMGAGQVFRNLFNTVANFEQGIANLNSVLNTTDANMKLLTASARELGGTTIFTAAQVAGLQTEFAKLGFSTQEILDATGATLELAAATGTDLARAAEVAGATIRGFGLNANETQRVVDVMALSFSKSALDTERFAESMKLIAPIAKVAGLSLEDTTAMLGKLADAGIHGSMAGTALREIISRLDKTGKTTGKALEDLSKKGMNLADAEEEVGKRAKTALLILADQTEQAKLLSTELDDAAGAAKRMADIQRDTLGGAVKLLTSAWEELTLRMNDASGIGTKFKNVLLFLADNLGAIFKVIGKVTKAFIAYRIALFAIKMADKVKDWRAFNREVKAGTTTMSKATAGVKRFGQALKGIGLGLLIGLLFEMGTELYRIASGAKQAEEDLDKLNKTAAGAAKSVAKNIDKINKATADRITFLQQEFNEKNIGQEEFNNKLVEEQKLNDKKLKDNKASAEARKKTYEETLAEIKTLDKATTNSDEERKKNRFKIKELAESIGVANDGEFSIFNNDEFGVNVEGLTGQITANISAVTSVVDAYGVAIEKSSAAVTAAESAERAHGKEVDNTTKSYKKRREAVMGGQFGIEADLAAKKEAQRLEREAFADNLTRINDSEEEAGLLRIERSRATSELEILLTNKTADEKARLIRENNIKALEAEIAFRKKWAEDTTNLEIELANAKAAIETEADAKELENKLKNLDTLNNIAQQSADYFIDQSNKKIAQIDKEIAAAENQLSTSKTLAANGNINAQQSLAAEQQLIVEANKKKMAEQKRQERIKFAAAAFGSYSNNVESGAANPLLKTITDMTLLRQFVASMPSFDVGSDGINVDGAGVDGKGGMHAIVHNKEKIFTAEDSAKIGYDMSNADVANTIAKVRSGELVSLHEGASSINMNWGMDPVISELKALKEVIQNKSDTTIEAGAIIQGAMQIAETKTKGNTVRRNKYIIR